MKRFCLASLCSHVLNVLFFVSLSGGCSEDLDAFRCFFKQSQWSAPKAMKINVDPFFPFPADSVLLLSSCTFSLSLSQRELYGSLVVIPILFCYITNYYLHKKIHCIDDITSLP